MVMVARYGERHSISLEKGGYPPLDGMGEGIFGASYGYYRRPGDGNRLVYVCVCDVKEEKNWFGGGCCDQDSTAGSCHSFDPFPPRIPPTK